MNPLDIVKVIKNLKAKRSNDTELEPQLDDYTPDEKPSKPKKASADKKKKLLAVALLALVTCSGASFVYFSIASDSVDTQVKPSTKKQASKNEQEKPSINDGIDLAKLSVNPFVEINKGEMVAAGDSASAPPVGAPAQASYQGSSNRGLPAIPSGYPRPNLPTFNKPAIPNSAPASVPQSSATPEISGIMTGNDGESIAIMSDGNVVMAGETYNDNRIAYIGGDGIHFSNGDSIEYK